MLHRLQLPKISLPDKNAKAMSGAIGVDVEMIILRCSLATRCGLCRGDELP